MNANDFKMRPGFKVAGIILLIVFALTLIAAIATFLLERRASTNQTLPSINTKSELTASPIAQATTTSPIETTTKFTPEMIASLEEDTLACNSKEELEEFTEHFIKGELTKAERMPGCAIMKKGGKLKILSVDYSKGEKLGIVEVVGLKSKSSTGAWAYTPNLKASK